MRVATTWSMRTGSPDRNCSGKRHVFDKHRVSAHIVRPGVKSPSTGGSAGMAPLARKDAALRAAQVQRKAHVWAPIVHCMDAAILAEERHRCPGDFDNEAMAFPDLIQAGNLNVLRGMRALWRHIRPPEPSAGSAL